MDLNVNVLVMYFADTLVFIKITVYETVGTGYRS